jgi:hypothetical protein
MIKNIIITSLAFISCTQLISCKSFVGVKQKGLYDIVQSNNMEEINGFNAIYIFKDDFDKSVWVSPETQCVTMKQEYKEVFADKGALHVKWDKVSGGCKWIGIGFGWNNWMAKDMLDITDIAAVQMQVKSVKGSFTNLPVAFAFEDYGGVQTFYGFNKTLVTQTFNDSTWTSVTIPLSNFNFTKNDFNIESVKQFMIQLEGDGDIYLDNIKFITLN